MWSPWSRFAAVERRETTISTMEVLAGSDGEVEEHEGITFYLFGARVGVGDGRRRGVDWAAARGGDGTQSPAREMAGGGR